MLKYWLKDLAAAGPFWGLILGLQAVFAVSLAESNLAFLAGNIACCSIYVLMAPILDDRAGIEPFLGALPGTRRQQVLARYTLSGGLVLLGAVCGLGLGWVLGEGLARPQVQLHQLLAPAGAIAIIGPAWLLVLAFLPLYYRLGLGRALALLPAVLAALGLLGAGLWRLGAALAAAGGPGWSQMIALLAQAPEAARPEMGPWLGAGPWTAPLAGLATAGATVLSVWLAVRAYDRRDL